jgi:alpha-glucosidase
MKKAQKQKEWWKGAVIYQIYPRSYQDSNGDGVGDLPGIISRLPYIADLGVDGIWLSPFFRSPMKDYGYDVSDYLDVDPMFGTLDDFKELLDTAHNLGLKVIIDQVYSHTSDRHLWFKESRQNKTNPKADWYVWADPKPDGTEPNNWLAEFGGAAWSFDIRRGQYYKHNFQPSMPDLNLYNPEVREAISNVMRFWLELGVDGFRLDVANMYLYDREFRDNPPKLQGYTRFGSKLGEEGFFYPYDMQYHIYNKCRPENIDVLKMLRKVCNEREGTMMVGEMFSDDSVVRAAEYTADDSLLHTAYHSQLSEPEYSATKIRNAVEHFLLTSPTSWPSWAFSNHDWIRVASRWAANRRYSTEQAKMLYALLCSLWGTIFVYQGDELGLENAELRAEDILDPLGRHLYPEYIGRDGSRTPMPWKKKAKNAGFSDGKPWLPVFERHYPLAVDAQEQDPDSMLNFVKTFLKLRKKHPRLIDGPIRFHDSHEDLLVFTRGDDMLCYFNLWPDEVCVPMPFGDWEPLEDTGFSFELKEPSSIILPGFGAAFLQIRR